nr:MAG TPA: hypothetical protein [Caudoviricetes sp.]
MFKLLDMGCFLRNINAENAERFLKHEIKSTISKWGLKVLTFF